MTGDVHIQTIDEKECFELLKTQSVGRLGIVEDGRPLIFPVNYVFDDYAIVFKTTIGTKFEHSGLNNVAFEVDSLDYATHSGWSIMIEGVGRDITNAIDNLSENERRLQFNSWVSDEDEHYVRIHINSISGRRIATG